MSSCILEPPKCGGVVRLGLEAPRARIALDLTAVARQIHVVPTPRIMISASAGVCVEVIHNKTARQPDRAASARRSRACLPCAWFCGQVPACA